MNEYVDQLDYVATFRDPDTATAAVAKRQADHPDQRFTTRPTDTGRVRLYVIRRKEATDGT